MRSRAGRVVAIVLCGSPLGGLVATGCKKHVAPLRAEPVTCIHDDCSLATLRAMITTERRAAELGQSHAKSAPLKGFAARIALDFREDEAHLDALERELALPETPCVESRRVAADFEARLPAPAEAFDEVFVTSQLAALREMKQTINLDLIGCAANGNLKTALRFERMRAADGGASAARGIVPDLEALQALADAETPPPPRADSRDSARSFVHPGILVTRAQLDFVKGNVARGAEPWASAFLRAKADPRGSPSYIPHSPRGEAATETTPATEDGIVLCGSFSDPDVHCSDEKEDGVAAYTQALLWYLSEDDRFARNAIAILGAWSALRDHRLFNGALQAAWMGTMFARAAEIMELSPLWAPADVAGFKAMMRRAFLPRLLAAMPGVAPAADASYGQNGNWILSIADSLIQLGVLLDDRDVFGRGVALWRDRAPAYCYLSSFDGPRPRIPAGGYGGANTGYADPATRTGDPSGYWGQAARAVPDGWSQETCRDLEHVQFGLAAIVNGAETARIQGIDLYREQAQRLAACLERAALYENRAPADAAGQILAYATPVDPAVTIASEEPGICPNAAGRAAVVLLNSGSLGSYAVQPTWEIGYNALVNRLGMTLPLTRQLIVRYRSPPAGWLGATHHIAWETLTHGEVGDVGLDVGLAPGRLAP